ncbi:MAG: HNH endonuclease [Rhodothermales bacterium]
MAAFDWLEEQVALKGDVLPRDLLAKGFDFNGQQIRFVSPQGIFKPEAMEYPLSITTVFGGPYDDSFDDDGLLSYRYRGTDPNHRDNRGLDYAMLNSLPLVYLHGVAKGRYLAVWPVYIVGSDPSNLTFTVAVDDKRTILRPENISAEDRSAPRKYITAVVRQRLHQRGFRERVLRAYSEQCAVCKLKHSELLDAAHIIGDSEERGDPVVTNGISLCKLHHAAFDKFFIGITPDYEVHVREDILNESDGPMLQHGLKERHGQRLIVPRSIASRPDRERLEVRYKRFRAAQ